MGGGRRWGNVCGGWRGGGAKYFFSGPKFPPRIATVTRECSCQKLAPMSNSWSLGQLLASRILYALLVREKITLAQNRQAPGQDFIHRVAAKVGQLLADSPSHGKLPCSGPLAESGNTQRFFKRESRPSGGLQGHFGEVRCQRGRWDGPASVLESLEKTGTNLT